MFEFAPAVRNTEARMAKETEIKRGPDQGKTLYDLGNMKPLFEAAGIVEIDGIWNDSKT
jgi:4-hydroxy-4-methyl-2-oxoglutarate aldolase